MNKDEAKFIPLKNNQMYNNIWRGILTSYCLTRGKDCYTIKTFINSYSDIYIYENINGDLICFNKNELLDKLENEGFFIKEVIHEDKPLVTVYFIISKDLVREKKNKAKTKRI